MAVGRRLRALRLANGVSMNKVHLETRMSTSYLAKLERDEFVPGEQNLRRIIAALDELGVKGADALVEEHEAVQREREMLVEMQKRLADIEDPDKRLEQLERVVRSLGPA